MSHILKKEATEAKPVHVRVYVLYINPPPLLTKPRNSIPHPRIAQAPKPHRHRSVALTGRQDVACLPPAAAAHDIAWLGSLTSLPASLFCMTEM